MSQFMASAAGEKLAVVLTMNYLRQQASAGRRGLREVSRGGARCRRRRATASTEDLLVLPPCRRTGVGAISVFRGDGESEFGPAAGGFRAGAQSKSVYHVVMNPCHQCDHLCYRGPTMRAYSAALVALLFPLIASAQPLPGTKLSKARTTLPRSWSKASIAISTKANRIGGEGTRQILEARLLLGAGVRSNRSRPNRERLRKMIGVIDERVPVADDEAGDRRAGLAGCGYEVCTRFTRCVGPCCLACTAKALLLEPTGKAKACAIAIPDADWTPEQLVGIAPGVPKESQFARRLAEDGYRVIVPTLLSRKRDFSGSPRLGRFTNQPHREFVYRMAYEMGRHVIGYEVQKVLAAVDWLPAGTNPCRSKPGATAKAACSRFTRRRSIRASKTPISAATSTIATICTRSRSIATSSALLKEFGDAELLMLAGATERGSHGQCRIRQGAERQGPACPGERSQRRRRAGHARFRRSEGRVRGVSRNFRKADVVSQANTRRRIEATPFPI